MKPVSGHAGKFKKIVINALKAGLTFGILYFLYQKGLLDLSRVKAVLTNVPVMLTAITLIGSTLFASVFRWWLLLKGQNLRVPLRETFRLSMIGVFFNTAIPGAVSGDLVKGYYVVRQQADGRGRIKAFTTLLLDRLLGLSALVCVSFFAMISNWQSVMHSPALRSLAGLISLLWAGVVVFYLFVLVEWPFTSKLLRMLKKMPAGDYLSRLFEAVKTYERCRHYIIKGLLISTAIHCSIVAAVILLARSLGGFEAVPIDKFFFLVPFGLLVTAIPVAPAGLGTGHAAFQALFQLVGSQAGAELFTAYVSVQLLISLTGGIFYLRYRGQLPRG